MEHVGGTGERCEKMQFCQTPGGAQNDDKRKRIKVLLSSYFCVEEHAGGRGRGGAVRLFWNSFFSQISKLKITEKSMQEFRSADATQTQI